MRTLLIRPGAIGDSILGFPALEHLKAEYTEVWVRSEIVPLVRFADCVKAISGTGLDMVEIDAPLKTMEYLGSFHRIHSWYGAARAEFREKVKGLRFEFHDALPPRDGSVHAADFFAAQVGAAVPAIPRIPVSGEWHGSVVVHPGSGSAAKNWPYERFVELGRRVKVEWAVDRYEDLGELARWIAGASVYVGNDSGITHLAAAVGTPVVALHGPTDPAVWGVRGKKARILRRERLADIAVEEVLHSMEEVRVRQRDGRGSGPMPGLGWW